MNDEFSVEITGIEESCAWLEKLPAELAKGALGKALTAAAVPVVEALEAGCPIMEDGSVHHNPPPGALKAAITTVVSVDARGQGGYAHVGFGKLGHIARFVEYGHRLLTHWENKVAYVVRGRKRIKKWGGHADIGEVQPKPFMRIAAAQSLDTAIEKFGESLQQSMDDGTVQGAKVA